MGKVKTDYRSLLIARAAQAQDEPASPLSLTEYRARQSIEAWRRRLINSGVEQSAARQPHKLEVAGANPAPATNSPAAADHSPLTTTHQRRAGFSAFLQQRLPWWLLTSGEA